MIQRLCGLAILLIPSAVLAQFGPPVDGYIIFKDGFTIHGKVIQEKTFEIDSGVVYVIPTPGGFTFIDDEVRRIYFPPGQIADVVKLKPNELTKEQIVLTKNNVGMTKPLLLPAWSFASDPPWDKHWEREIRVSTGGGTSSFPMHQRIVQLTPQRMRIRSKTHNWEMNFLTSEIGDQVLKKLLLDYFEMAPDFKKYSKEDKEFILGNFYLQMGRLEDAERIGKELLEKSPENKKKVDLFLDVIAIERAKRFSAEFEPLAGARQHRTLLERIKTYDKDQLSKNVPEKTKLLVQELKNRYESDNDKLKKTRELLTFLMSKNPDPRGVWLEAIDTIRGELNYDTLPRLDTFITFAEQYKQKVAQNQTPEYTLEKVLSLAVTGWYLGTIAAEPDVKLAQTLLKARRFVPEYMKTDTAAQRAALADNWAKEAQLPIDVVARFLQHLPPPNAYKDPPTAGFFNLSFDLPDSPNGSYLVQLPPDYNHHRAHPLLLLIHGGRESPDILLQRWTALAARHGFILAAPLWAKFSKQGYNHSQGEQTYFMNCLKDLKRRFQIDTNRVFMFGWAQGAEIAWDVGFAHPDQFAGVLPMCGVPSVFPKSYWPNAQNLGLYIVDGDKSGPGPPKIREMFKDFIRRNYNAYYLEYKGRSNELYVGEFEPMMEWMSRKKRQYPMRDLGIYSANGFDGQEFRSFRQSDNRFYWLGADEINDANTQDYANWSKTRRPAMFEGKITVSNEADSKGDARITTQVQLHISGVKQVSVWLSPGMIDFTKPVQFSVNGKLSGKATVVSPSIPAMLEDYFTNVDRQQLYYARVDLKL